MTERKKTLLTIILIGSIWGGVEALISSASHSVSFVMPRSVILAFVAVLILTTARVVLPKSGTTILIGCIAAGFKLLSLPSVYGCQIAAVIGQAALLDLAFSFGHKYGIFQRPLLLGTSVAAASYLNSISFGFSQAYIFGNQFWIDRGIGGLLTWSFGTGSIAALVSVAGALLAIVTAPKLVPRWNSYTQHHAAAFVRCAFAVSLSFWMIGIIVVTR